jgi:hypothetical protein
VTTPSLEDTSCNTDASSDNLPTALAGDSTAINKIKKELKAHNMLCRENHHGIFWPTLGKCVAPTAGTSNIIFAADFRNSDTATRFTGNEFIDAPLSSGMQELKATNLSPLALVGRTMTIEPTYEA